MSGSRTHVTSGMYSCGRTLRITQRRRKMIHSENAPLRRLGASVCSSTSLQRRDGRHSSRRSSVLYCVMGMGSICGSQNGTQRRKGAETERAVAGNSWNRRLLSEAPIRKRQYSVGYKNHRSAIAAGVPSQPVSASRIRSFDRTTFVRATIGTGNQPDPSSGVGIANQRLNTRPRIKSRQPDKFPIPIDVAKRTIRVDERPKSPGCRQETLI
jgi:hypothetical protein